MSYSEFVNRDNAAQELTIEFILEEASSYGLRSEVQESARKIKSEFPDIDLLTAYEMAFNEWIK